MKKVTNDDILQINTLYFRYKNYAEVARQTGFAASTVKKYVNKNWKPVETQNIIKFDLAQLPDFNASIFVGIDNYGELCILTEREEEKMKGLWEELAL